MTIGGPATARLEWAHRAGAGSFPSAGDRGGRPGPPAAPAASATVRIPATESVQMYTRAPPVRPFR